MVSDVVIDGGKAAKTKPGCKVGKLQVATDGQVSFTRTDEALPHAGAEGLACRCCRTSTS